MDGTYNNVTLVLTSSPTPQGTFAAPVVNITVSGGTVTAVTLVSGGNIINTSMTFSANNSSLGGSGSGFSIPVATVTTGTNNTAVGYAAGRNNITGSGNVFLGYLAGTNETGSNKLYISNTNTATPLILGNFDSSGGTAGNLKINGDLIIKSKTPASAIDTGTAGEIAWDSSYFYVCTATNTWTRIALAW